MLNLVRVATYITSFSSYLYIPVFLMVQKMYRLLQLANNYTHNNNLRFNVLISLVDFPACCH